MVLFFLDLWHLAELVHVQLSDKRRQVLVTKIMWQHLFLKLFRILDEDLLFIIPSQVLAVLFFLTNPMCYLENMVELKDELWDALLVGFDLWEETVHGHLY